MASRDGLSRSVLVAAVIVLVGVVVWQRGATTSTGAGVAAPSPSTTAHKKGVVLLSPTRLRQPVDLSLAGIQELPPPHTATPKVSARRAIAIAGARHAPGAQSAQAVLVVITDPSAGMSHVLAWDVREVGCFGTEVASKASASPKPRSKAKSTSKARPKSKAGGSPRPAGSPTDSAAPPPVPCSEHQLVIVAASSGRVVETVSF